MRRALKITSAAAIFLASWGWHALDVIGRGDVFMKLPDLAMDLQHFILKHQEIGYQVAPWMLMAVSLLALVLMQWPHLLRFRSNRGANQTSILGGLPDRLIPMPEAATQAYTKLRHTTEAQFLDGFGETPENKLIHYATALASKIPVFGRCLPSMEHDEIRRGEFKKGTLEKGTFSAKGAEFRRHDDKEARWVDLEVRESDLLRAIEQMRNGEESENFVPIHNAVAHVAARIGDTDEGQCYPTTRTALRQKASDGSLQLRGRKELNIEGQTRFSDVHIDIPKEYWANSLIGSMATSSAYENRDTHTNPETAYSWGLKGVYEKNRYSSLLVEWNEVLRLWPK